LGEDSPEVADLYFAYGKALLENAVAQNSVLGKNQPEGEDDEAEGSSEPLVTFAHTFTHLM
jgi:HAT1-interacting factor 1